MMARFERDASSFCLYLWPHRKALMCAYALVAVLHGTMYKPGARHKRLSCQ